MTGENICIASQSSWGPGEALWSLPSPVRSNQLHHLANPPRQALELFDPDSAQHRSQALPGNRRGALQRSPEVHSCLKPPQNNKIGVFVSCSAVTSTSPASQSCVGRLLRLANKRRLKGVQREHLDLVSAEHARDAMAH